MSIYPILIAPHPSLKQKSLPNHNITQHTHTIVNNLLDTMYHADALGISAPQVNIPQRIAVIDVNTHTKNPLVLINPQITWSSNKKITSREGCLSFPSIYLNIPRAQKIRIQYQDLNAKLQTLETESSLLTICIQHEIDHLNGTLFIDYLSSIHQNIILRKMQRIQKKSQTNNHTNKI